jgi:hypothetical protein
VNVQTTNINSNKSPLYSAIKKSSPKQSLDTSKNLNKKLSATSTSSSSSSKLPTVSAPNYRHNNTISTLVDTENQSPKNENFSHTFQSTNVGSTDPLTESVAKSFLASQVS